MILEGEIKDAKMTSFSSDFQTLIKHNFFFIFSLYIINEYESFNSKLFPSFNLEMIFTHFRERRAGIKALYGTWAVSLKTSILSGTKSFFR